MSAKPNYFKLGLFILISLVLLVTGIILFGSGFFGEDKIYFETYFTGSVAGLSTGAPVQSNGVQIGTVEKISFIRNDYDEFFPTTGFTKYYPYVRVIASVSGQNLPEITHEERQERLDDLVANGLRLRLSTNILTGQGYIEAEYLEPERFPVEKFPWDSEHPFIPSAPSTFTTLKDSVDKILRRLEQIETEKIGENINEVLLSIDQAIDDLDIPGVRQHIDDLVVTANKAIDEAQIPAMSKEITGLFVEARETNEHLKKLLANPDPDKELSNIAELVDQLNATMTRVDRMIRTHAPRLAELRENVKQISDKVNRLTENLEENPSDLIFSQPPEKKEDAK